MTRLIKLFLITLISILFLHTALADDSIPIKINFVNNMPRTGNADINMQSGDGPIVERNGGTASMTVNGTKDHLISIGFDFAFMGISCMTADGNYTLTLNPNLYTGDTLTITYIALQSGSDNFPNLICSCAGSACDQSATKK